MAGERLTGSEEFEAGDLAAAIRSSLLVSGCLGLVAAALAWFIASALLGMMGVPNQGLWGLVVAVLLLVVIVGIKVLQVRAQFAKSRIRVSEHGIEQHDAESAVRRIAWQDMVGVDFVKPIQKMADVRAGTAQSKAIGSAIGTAAAETGRTLGKVVGVIGYGEVEFGPRASGLLREGYAGAFGGDAHGRPFVGITPGMAATDWYDGRLGEWFAGYRPDILEQARQMDAWFRAGAKGQRPVAPPEGAPGVQDAEHDGRDDPQDPGAGTPQAS